MDIEICYNKSKAWAMIGPFTYVFLVLVFLYICASLLSLGTTYRYIRSRQTKSELAKSKPIDSGIDSCTIEEAV